MTDTTAERARCAAIVETHPLPDDLHGADMKILAGYALAREYIAEQIRGDGKPVLAAELEAARAEVALLRAGIAEADRLRAALKEVDMICTNALGRPAFRAMDAVAIVVRSALAANGGAA